MMVDFLSINFRQGICCFCNRSYFRHVSEPFVLTKALVKYCTVLSVLYYFPFCPNFSMAQNCFTVHDKLSASFKRRLVMTQSPFPFPPINTHPRGVNMAMGPASFPILTLRLRCRLGKSAPINIDIPLL